MRRFWLSLVPVVLLATAAEYQSAGKKFRQIEEDRAPRGSVVTLSDRELNAYAATEAAKMFPTGVRNLRLELGQGVATGSALVNCLQLRRATGEEPGWLMSKILDGERPIRVTAHIRSARGSATVDLDRVEISGATIEGRVLDYLTRNYLKSYFPEAKVGEPFELADNIDRIEVRPTAAAVFIRR